MLLLFHVIVALAGLLASTATLFRPSRDRFIISSFLVSLTLVSGTILVVSRHDHLLSACLSGLVYLSVVASELLLAKRRLVKITANVSH